MGVVAFQIIAQAFIAYTIGRIAQNLLEEDSETPLVDEKPTTSSTKGSFAPLIIGEYRIGPVIAWVGNRVNIPEDGGSGGKGFSGGGGEEQDVWFEEAVHFLCVGPAFSLRNIWSNGEKLSFNGGVAIDSNTHPSGTAITAFSPDLATVKGVFVIYWGKMSSPVDPIDPFIAQDSRLGITSRWPYQCHIDWTSYRLGGFAVWPTLEYEVQVRPFSLAGSQLTNAANWGAFNFGDPAFFRTVLEVGNSIRFTPPQIKVPFDRTSDFVPNTLAIVQNQFIPSVNRKYVVDSSTFNAGDAVVDTTQVYVPMTDGTIDSDLRNWTKSTDDNISVTKFIDEVEYPFGWPEGETPADGAIFRCQENQTEVTVTDVHIRTLTIDVAGNGGNTFSRGGQEVIIWIRGIIANAGNPNFAEWIEIGFVNNGTDPIPSNAVYSRYTIIGGNLVITNFNGARSAGAGDNTNAWVKTFTRFKTEGGETDGSISELDTRTVFFRWPSAGFTQVRFDIYLADIALGSTTWIGEDAGDIVTGTTTIKLNDTLSSAYDDFGEIGAMVPGTGEGGANMAYLLEQLLFETFPHGAGLSRDTWDMVSLNQLAQDTEDETARIMMIADRGKSIKGMIALLLQDMHAFISWDPIIGKYIFGLMRDPGANPVPNIPIEAILSPAPEIQTIHQFSTPNMIVFGFRNREKNYRTDTAPIDDDATASAFNNRIIKNVKISVATDYIFAKQIAERRQTEDLIPATIYKILAGREARLLTAGASFTTDEINEPLRLIDLELNTESSKVKITAVTDIFAIAGEIGLPQNFGGDRDSKPEEALEDLATAIWELPPFLSQNTVSIAIPRIRSGSHIGNAFVLISTDDISYNRVKGAPFLASGGALTSGIPASSKLELRGTDAPSISALGEDILHISETLSDENWKTGKQLALIGNEVYYLKQLVPVGGGVYHMDGLIRARLGTEMAVHSAGDTVFIFSRNSIKRIVDPFLIPTASIFIKTVPKGVSATSITAKNPTITGTGIKPIAVSAVRTLTSSPSFSTGENITIKWNFQYPLALAARSGAGFQTAGEVLPEPTIGPQEFRVTITGGLIQRVIVTTVATITYTNSQMLTDNNSSEFSPTFNIVMIYNGYPSPSVAYTVELV